MQKPQLTHDCSQRKFPNESNKHVHEMNVHQ